MNQLKCKTQASVKKSSTAKRPTSAKSKKQAPAKKRRDLHAELTQKIIDALERGVKPWTCPWVRNHQNFLPINALTKKAYNGMNIVMLWMRTSESNFENNLWLTFKQASDLKANVIKGEKGTTCIYYNVVEREDELGQVEKIPFVNAFTLFNVAQIENLPEDFLPPVAAPEQVEPQAVFEIHAQAEAVMKDSGAKIYEQGQNAFFSPKNDHIMLPTRDKFKVSGDFYATAMHELTHWTGHSSRLNRDICNKFGSKDYAFEELVAELGAAFICGELGVQGTVEHESYLAGWLKRLKEDKKAIFRASSLASKAVNLLLPAKEA
jgi:antirestriction protein ArdC